MQACYWQGVHCSADREGCKISVISRKTYPSLALNLRIASCVAIMSGFQLFLWERISLISTSYQATNSPLPGFFKQKPFVCPNNRSVLEAIQQTHVPGLWLQLWCSANVHDFILTSGNPSKDRRPEDLLVELPCCFPPVLLFEINCFQGWILKQLALYSSQALAEIRLSVSAQPRQKSDSFPPQYIGLKLSLLSWC